MEKSPVEFGRERNSLLNQRCGVQDLVEGDFSSLSPQVVRGGCLKIQRADAI
jgi:hypothetical protein